MNLVEYLRLSDSRYAERVDTRLWKAKRCLRSMPPSPSKYMGVPLELFNKEELRKICSRALVPNFM